MGAAAGSGVAPAVTGVVPVAVAASVGLAVGCVAEIRATWASSSLAWASVAADVVAAGVEVAIQSRVPKSTVDYSGLLRDRFFPAGH